jgi:hypothetical protein
MPLAEDVRAELTASNAARHDWLVRGGRPDRTIIRAGYRRRSDFVASRTDPDAALMARKQGGVHFGYHDHYAVDGGKARIIVEVLVTPADVMENQPLLDLLWRARCRWRLPLRQVTGDTTYGTIENIVALEGQGIRAYVPLPDFDERTPYYGTSKFVYHPEPDAYRCPEGHPLHRWRAKYTEEVIVYRADAATCNTCPVKPTCTGSHDGRQVRRSFYAAELERVRGYHQTDAYQKAMRKRAVWVEPLFGEAKDWHGLRRFRLRTLWKVNVEALLIASGQNLKRLLRKRGWGRRPWPHGAPEVVHAGFPRGACILLTPCRAAADQQFGGLAGTTALHPTRTGFSTGWHSSRKRGAAQATAAGIPRDRDQRRTCRIMVFLRAGYCGDCVDGTGLLTPHAGRCRARLDVRRRQRRYPGSGSDPCAR